MKIGSLFAGYGGLDAAAERAFDARTSWQLDLVGAQVRQRHWPDARQIEADVRTVDPLDLGRVDVLAWGFPCVDLSVAGPRPDDPLDSDDRSGLYQQGLRFVEALRPDFSIIENVSALLGHMGRLVMDFRRLGYGLSWTVCEAADAGAPQLRRRVFVLAERGAHGRGLVEVDQSGRWQAEDDLRTWATPSAANVNEGESPESWEARRQRNLVKHGNGNGQGEPLAMQVRPWGTPTASEDKGRNVSLARRADPDMLSAQVRPWPTVTARDYKTGDLPNRVGTEAMSAAAGAPNMGTWGRRLNPDWVEQLMGLPAGWTSTTGPQQEIDWSPRWPRGRYPADWDRSIPWPQRPHEAPRTLPDGEPAKGRPAQIRQCGNGVVPQQGTLALDALLGRGVGQVLLFGGAACSGP